MPIRLDFSEPCHHLQFTITITKDVNYYNENLLLQYQLV